ncbi:putative Zn(2)-C6 fungal-type domain-containing protein [Seiridium cardinale]
MASQRSYRPLLPAEKAGTSKETPDHDPDLQKQKSRKAVQQACPHTSSATAADPSANHAEDVTSKSIKQENHAMTARVAELEYLVDTLKHAPDKTALAMLRNLRDPDVTDHAPVAQGMNTAQVQYDPPSEADTIYGAPTPAQNKQEPQPTLQYPAAFSRLDPQRYGPRADGDALWLDGTQAASHEGDQDYWTGPSLDEGATNIMSTSSFGLGRSYRPSSVQATASMTFPSTTQDFPPYNPQLAAQYCDPRLEALDISFWTDVPVTNRFAAGAISHYLDIEHQVLGLFDAQSFIGDLVGHRIEFCSPFLVSSLLSFASHGYTFKDPSAAVRSYEFRDAAEKLWHSEMMFPDSLTNVSALVLLFSSFGCCGKPDLGDKYKTEASDMIKRLRLFGAAELLGSGELACLTRAEQLATHDTTRTSFDAMV